MTDFTLETNSMKLTLPISLLLTLAATQASAATFTSNGTGGGAWNDAASWIVTSGTDADNIPDIDDNVTVLAGDNILANATPLYTNGLTVDGTLTGSTGNTLYINGNYTVNGTEAGTGGAIAFIGPNSGTISGGGTFSTGIRYAFAKSRTILAGTTINKTGATSIAANTTVTNQGSFTLTSISTSSGSRWINSTNATLVIRSNGFLTGTGRTFDATAAGNTVTLLYTTGSVPLATGYYNLTVGGSGSKSLGATTTVANNLTISSTATLNTSGFNLNVGGNWSQSGILTNTSGTITFNGSSAQTITMPATQTVANMVINNASGVTLSSATTLTIAQSLTASAGIFNAGTNRVTLVSDATSTARLGITGATGGYSGSNFLIQRFISARTGGWDDLSSPVQNSTILDWDNELIMSGVGGADGNSCCPIWYSAYSYNEPTVTYTPVTSTATPLTPGRGFEIWLASASSATVLDATTLTTIGTPNYGDHPIAISHTTGNSDPGWNLIGNPFASAIDWSNLTKNDLDGSFYIYDPGSSSYTARSSGDIPHTQGFYVFANSPASTLTIPESAKSASNSSVFYKTAKPAAFTMKIKSAALPFSHTAELSFDAAATSGYESGMDARYLKSPEKRTPEIFMHTDNGTSVMKNVLNPSAETVEVPVTVKIGQKGVHTIETSGLDNIQNEYTCVMLKDNELGKTIDLTATSAYSFEAAEGVIENRFVITLTKDGAGCEQALAISESSMLNERIDVINSAEGVFVQFNFEESTDATIAVVNVLGQEIMNRIETRAGKQLVKIDAPSGINGIHFITVTVNGSQFTDKIYLGNR